MKTKTRKKKQWSEVTRHSCYLYDQEIALKPKNINRDKKVVDMNYNLGRYECPHRGILLEYDYGDAALNTMNKR